MAKFDVYRLPHNGGHVLDCQADVLRGLNTRLVVPLMPVEDAPTAGARLNPIFEVDGHSLTMVTQYAATMPLTDLRDVVASLAEHEYTIGNALDVLITGV